MVVGVIRLELVLYGPSSLKEKRGIVRRILGRIRSRFPVSAAEVGDLEFYQRSVVGLCMVHYSEIDIRNTFNSIENEILATALADISERQIEILHY